MSKTHEGIRTNALLPVGQDKFSGREKPFLDQGTKGYSKLAVKISFFMLLLFTKTRKED